MKICILHGAWNFHFKPKHRTPQKSSMDLNAEYEEFAKIAPHVAVTYKFFSLFSISKDGVLSWCEDKFQLDEESATAVKAFLKASKAFLRDTPGAKHTACAGRMWFWYNTILEKGWFDRDVRAEILRWMEVCELVVS